MDWKEDVVFLEDKYADRGLVFTSPFEGANLVQAFGHLDGYRFYFRLRNGEASLRVGAFDRSTEASKVQRRRESLNRLFEDGILSVSPDGEVHRIPEESDIILYPTTLLFFSHADSYPHKMSELFSILIETLEPVTD